MNYLRQFCYGLKTSITRANNRICSYKLLATLSSEIETPKPRNVQNKNTGVARELASHLRLKLGNIGADLGWLIDVARELASHLRLKRSIIIVSR